MPVKPISGIQIIKKEIGIALAEYGFQFHDSSSLLRFTHSDLFQFFHFQKGISSLNGKFTINVVQQGLFVPGCSLNVLQPGGRIGEFTEESKDKWWYCNTHDAVLSSLPDIKKIIVNDVLPFFELASTETALPDVIDGDRYKFIWKNELTFVDKGYFYLKCRQYEKAMKTFQLKPSRVNKFKSIKKFIEKGEFEQIQNLLSENVHHAKSRIKI